jgi:hypothetical protein
LKLLKLIEKFILKQSDNQYKIGIIIDQWKLLLAYRQDDAMTNAAYYNQFKTRVDVAEHIGVSFDNPTLWDWKSQELYGTDFDLLSDTVKEDKSRMMLSKPFWCTYSSSIAMTRSTVNSRRLWPMIMQRETERHFPAVAMQSTYP